MESRLAVEGMRRRRECSECRNRFTTYEKPVFQFLVIKKDGREESFNLEKIKNSLGKACCKAESKEVEELTRKVEQRILLKKKNPLKTSEIGKMVLQELRKFDKIAYVRYATVHKSIDNPMMLKKEIQLIA